MRRVIPTLAVLATTAFLTVGTAQAADNMGLGKIKPDMTSADKTSVTTSIAGDAARAESRNAVFVLTNNQLANSVAAYARGSDGQLTLTQEFLTGGKGGALNGAETDKLASQGALTYDANHKLLYAVNAGSDSLTVFRVRGSQLHKFQTISSRGDFPVSVAVHDRLVYVLNGGGTASVQGFRLTPAGLKPMRNSHRDLGLKVVTDKMQFVSTPGQIGFSPDGTRLVVTTKANGSKILLFWVRGTGGLRGQAVSQPSATPVPFAFEFDGANRLVVAEAGMSTVTTYRIGLNSKLTRIGGVANGQTALCWILRVGDVYYGTNTGGDGSKTNGSISAYRLSLSGAPTLIATTPVSNTGTTDIAASADGRFLYAESGGTSKVDIFAIGTDGALTRTGEVAVPNGLDLEGIAAL